MAFTSLASNQAVSYTNLQDAVNNGIFTLVSAITSTGQESTKSYVAAHVSGFNANYPPYVNKANNQLIVQRDIYHPGNFILDAAYGMSFTSLSGSVGLPTFYPSSFSFPVSGGNTTKTYQNIVAAQTFTIGLSGTLVSSPAKIVLLVDGVQVDCQNITSGVQTKTLILPNTIPAPSSIKISINLSACTPPPINITGQSVDVVAVSKTSGQYMLAGVTISKRYDVKAGYLYLSSSYGNSWTNTGLYANWTKVAISGNGKYMLATSDCGQYYGLGDIYQSTDYGVSWSAINILSNTHTIRSCAISSTGQYQTVVASETSVFNQKNIVRSSDYGATWSTSISFPANKNYNFISNTMDSTGQYQSITTQFSISAYLDFTNEVYYSTDYGVTFSISSGFNIIPNNDYYDYKTDISSSPNGLNLLLQISSIQGNTTTSYLYKSSNHGATWSLITTDSSYLYYTLATNDTTTNFVIKSSTNYISKINSLSTLSDLTTAGSKLWNTIDMSNSGNYILAGTSTGLYLSADSGATFTAIT
jgi:hypothetical protein